MAEVGRGGRKGANRALQLICTQLPLSFSQLTGVLTTRLALARARAKRVHRMETLADRTPFEQLAFEFVSTEVEGDEESRIRDSLYCTHHRGAHL